MSDNSFLFAYLAHVREAETEEFRIAEDDLNNYELGMASTTSEEPQQDTSTANSDKK